MRILSLNQAPEENRLHPKSDLLGHTFPLQKGLISETMQQTAEVPVSSRGGPAFRLPVNDLYLFSALRDSYLGSGQKE